MKGDVTRESFRQYRHYRGVRMQQGRVQLDADWNEQLAIDEHLDRTESRDVIGLCGAPIHDGGFRIVGTLTNAAGDEDLLLAPGRIYVDGLLCELDATPVTLTSAPAGSAIEVETRLVDGRLLDVGQWVELSEGATTVVAEIIGVLGRTLALSQPTSAFSPAARVRRATTYLTQPDLPTPAPFDPTRDYVCYLEVWQRHITEHEDEALREPALGGPDSGPDTTTRAQTVWQVRLEEVDPALTDPTCDDFGHGWMPSGGGGVAALRARAEPDPSVDDPCLVPPEAGYRRLEHQLYRIEVHQGTNSAGLPPTFKWSRDNGSVVYPITGVASAGAPATVEVSHTGRDAYLTIKEEDIVEVVDDRSALSGQVDDLYSVDGVDPADRQVTLSAGLPGSLAQDPDAHPLARRWDHRPRTGVTVAADGALEIDETGWLPLEAGVEIQFRPGGIYRAGDHWLVPARAGVREGVLWPTENDTDDGAVFQEQHGIERDYCVLGLVLGGEPEDCRPEFPPLTELDLYGCCRRIEVGDDVQAAIDAAIAAGGGCLCLARGTHMWSGPLRIHGGQNISVHGEPGAQLVLSPDGSGSGGISVRGSRSVEIGDLFVTGRGVPWLIRVLADADGGVSRHVRLHGLQLFHAEVVGGEDWSGAVLLGGVHDAAIERCSIVAGIGVLAVDWPTAGFPTLADRRERSGPALVGVRGVSLTGTTIRFASSGIAAFTAHDWSVDHCTIEALARETLAGLATDRAAEVELADRLPRAVMQDPAQAATVFDLVFGSPTDPRSGRAAIEGLVWVDPAIRSSRLTAARGFSAAGLVRGAMSTTTIAATDVAVLGGVLHRADLRENVLSARNGAGVALAAGSRIDIDENTIEGRIGIANVPPGRILSEVAQAVPAFARGLRSVASEGGEEVDDEALEALLWWILLEEVVDLLDLRGLVDAIEAALLRRDGGFPILAFVAVALQRADRPDVGDGGSHAPIVDLTIDGNDIEADLGISLQDHLPLGGLRIAGNQVLSGRQQAIVVNAGVFGRNPALLSAVLGAGVRWVAERLPGFFDAVLDSVDGEQRVVLEQIFDEIERLVDMWFETLLRILDTDYTIRDNTLRTRSVVLESNLYEVEIRGNHVVQEQGVVVDVLADVLSTLRASAETEAVGDALALGDPVYEQPWARATLNSLAPSAVEDIARCIPEGVGAPEEPPGLVVGRPPYRIPLGPVGRMIKEVFAGPAIWVKSPGADVSGNTVIVPPDGEVRSWGRGGVLVKGDEPVEELFVLVVAAALLQVEMSPMFWMTETKVTDNEITGGYGHGIRVAETYLPIPALGDLGALTLVAELAIRGNTIRHMGGVGILVDEDANAVGVDIDANAVRDCSFDARIIEAGVVDTIGGIVAHNLAFLKIHANRVTACGGSNVLTLSAIEIDRAFHVNITDNVVIHAASAGRSSMRSVVGDIAGIAATLVLGAVSVADNEVSTLGNVPGIAVQGAADLSEWVISPALVANVLLYLDLAASTPRATGTAASTTVFSSDSTEPAGQACRARICDNNVSQAALPAVGHGIVVVAATDLVVTSNLVRGPTLQIPSAIRSIGSVSQAVVGHNLADAIDVGHIVRGTVTGNRARLGLTVAGGAAVGLNSEF